jgi:geranylgeranyl diphosphate synthase type II
MYTSSQLLEKIEAAIADLKFPTRPALLYEPQSYALLSSGKRVRPLLTLLVANLFSENIDREKINVALAVELFHTFTLIHDDIMDHADLRRGYPTVVNKWGSNVAILSGDAMLIESYRLLSTSSQVAKLLPVLNQAALDVCEGQQLDVDFEQLESVTEVDYLEMIGKKTASLLAASAVMGALSAGANEHQVKILREFAYKLGLAFQLQDDYLDTYADVAVFGKQPGGDIAVGKKTFLFVTACQNLSENDRAEFLALMKDNTLPCNEKFVRVKAFYDKANVEQIVQDRVEKLSREAEKSLVDLGIDIVKTLEFNTLLNSLIKRVK